MDRYLISGSILALVLEVTWLLGDLGIIALPYFQNANMINTQPAIGYISSVQQDVRRRKAQSLIWEDATAQTEIYNQDSVLTLSASSALLQLDGGTELNIFENTLVVIEPQTALADDSNFILKITRGDFRARTKTNTLIETANDWTIELSEGSDLSLRNLDNGKIEVEVHSGQAQLMNESSGDKQNINPSQIIELNQQQIEEVKTLSQQLRWSEGQQTRFYAHQVPTPVELNWLGAAQKLTVVNSGQNENTIELQADQTSALLTLEAGNHMLRLTNEQETSSTLEIEVFRAPVVHLLSPLPRDRQDLKQKVQFHWSEITEAKQYKLQISQDREFKQISQELLATKNSAQLQLSFEGSFYWRVLALDSSGTIIPAVYFQPLYVIEDPLNAPKLKDPLFIERLPADKPEIKSDSKPQGLLWLEKIFSYILPRAHAETPVAIPQFSPLFEWEAVKGAKRYVIEIDSNKNFVKPILVEKINENKFYWTNASRGLIYWRVAAEGEDGKLGLFSAPKPVDLGKLFIQKQKQFAQQKAAHEAQQKALEEEKLKALLAEEESRKKPKEPVKREATQIIALIGTGYQANSFQAPQAVKAKFNGVSMLHLGTEVEIPYSDQTSWTTFANVLINAWRNNNKPELAEQDALSEIKIELGAHYGQREEAWRYGVSALKFTDIKRSDYEALIFQDLWALKPTVLYHFKLNPTWGVQQHMGLVLSSPMNGLQLKTQFLYKPTSALNLQYRLNADLHYLTGQERQQSLIFLGFMLGW